MKQQKSNENCMRSFTICTLHLILLGYEMCRACSRKQNANKILVGQPHMKRSHVTPGHKWKNNAQSDFSVML
jgi:hypothetical protein